MAAAASPSSDLIASISLLYIENAKVAAIFWEWRHKILERFLAACAAILVACGWMYQHGELRRLLFIPLLIGAIYCIISFLMDRVNAKVLLGCYATGKTLEQHIGQVGTYTRISDDYPQIQFGRFLRVLYVGGAAAFATMSILALVLVH